MSIKQESLNTKQGLRRYPPLLFMVLVLLIVALVLPSALNLPQANPTTVLEYAPVPPEDEEPPPSAEGNVSNLGLGVSSGLTTGAPPPVPQVEQGKAGSGRRPVTKRCVGKPLRQTEDPNSPPCVPFFEGDNGGATWQGVTKDEIVILIYYSAFTRGNGENSPGSANPYCDIDGPPNSLGCRDPNEGTDIDIVKAVRALSKYFNDRFQTYDRRVHMWMFFGSASSAATRRAHASDNWSRLKPFAVIDNAFFGGFNEAYQEAMIRRRASVYGSFVGLQNEHFRKYAPQLWGFWPDIEHSADLFVDYVCKRVAPFPVSHSGNPGENGKPRTVALMRTTDSEFPGLQYFAELVKVGFNNCPNGARLDIATEVTYSRNQFSTDASPDAVNEARANIGKMRSTNPPVTTVLWLQGHETHHSKAARTAEWYPEWIFAGDQLQEGIGQGRDQDQSVWKFARGTTHFVNEAKPNERPCVQAFREADPNYADGEVDFADFDACNAYRDMFTVYKAIQVAGPHLSPQTVDQGHHAIPKQASTDPRVAACFYDPGDYTCVKDAQEYWWDPDAPDPEGDVDSKGCYRMVYSGRRFLAGGWPQEDLAFRDRSNPCNAVDAQGFTGTPLDD